MIGPELMAPDGARLPGRWTVLYDGDCNFCRRTVRRLQRLDRDDRLALVPYQDREVAEFFAWLSRDALEDTLHVVSPAGEVWTGARAVERLVPLLRGGRVPALIFRLPLVRPLADRVYRWIARNRHRLGCGEHCPTEG
jgi:predicted DCC family thiol-disulfide oxidoreductase YuxK